MFLGPILQPVFNSSHAANVATLPIAGGLVFFTLVAAVLVDRAGRVPLLTLSAILMGLSSAAIGLCFYLDDHADLDLGWLAMASLISYFAAFSLGVGPIPWILASELFDPAIRGTANSVVTFTMFTFAFITVEFLTPLKRLIGLAALFWAFCVACFALAIFVVAYVPETRGKMIKQ